MAWFSKHEREPGSYQVRECEYCGRPFVEYGDKIDHERKCRRLKQDELDRQWEADHVR